MAFKSKRQEVESAMLDMLNEALPDITWSRIFKGFQREKGVSGSLVNDKTEFSYDAKDQLVATARYVIIVADADNLDTVDDTADTIFELLDCDDLNGTAIIGEVKSISYAAAPNKADAGAALIVYQVKYYV